MELLYILSFLIFLFNIPFGFWRENCKKFSVNWFLSIHLPIPFIILARFLFNIPYSWESFFFFVIAFFLGQFLGKKINQKVNFGLRN